MDPLFADFDSLSSMTKEKAEKNVQEALNYLRLDFRNLGTIIGQYHPLEILKMAAWEERRIARTKSREPLAAATGRLLPVLLQSVVQSTFYDVSHGISTNRNIKDKDWQRIRNIADDVSKRLLRSIECYTVLMVRSGKISEDSALKYRELLFEEAFPPLEDIERVERLSYMTYAAMIGAGSTIEEKYGASPEVLVDQMYRIIRRGLDGIDKLSEEASVYKSEVETLMAQKRASDPSRIISDEDLIHEIIKENGWEARVSRLAGERDDFDLFRPDFAANLPDKTYEALSVYPGTLDIDAMMMKGLWPATIYPFLHFGDMYFSFVSQHIQSYSLRIMQETAGLYLQYSEATNEALRLIFRESDEVDVYTFDGNKVDVSIKSSLIEVNAFTSPELFQTRLLRRKEEGTRKPSIGHKALIVEPDSFEELRKISDDVFSSSAYFIIKSAEKAETRKTFYKTIFGQLEMPEPDEYDALIDPDEIEYDDKIDEDVLSDDITDEYEYDNIDEDEKEKVIEEKEKELENTIPEDFSDYERSMEIAKLSEKYELTSNIIKRDEEMEAEADEYEKELDDDDFAYDDPDDNDSSDDDIDPEAERIYDEAEKDDIYADENYTDPDQLTFFDELFGDDKESEKIADEEFADEEEDEFEEAEAEAENFSLSNKEHVNPPFINVASEEDESDDPVRTNEDEMGDFPCFDEESGKDESPSEESDVDNPRAEESAENEDVPSPYAAEEESTPEDSSGEPENPEESEDASVPEEAVGEEGDCKLSAEENSSVAGNEDVPAPSEAEESLPENFPGEPENPEEAESAYASSECAVENADDEEADEQIVESETDENAEDIAVSDNLHSSDMEETTETLIDKGLVKPVESEGGGSVFVMTEAEDVPVAEDSPELDLDGILGEIASHLDANGPFMKFLSSSDEEMVSYLEKVIKSSWERQKADGKDKMFSIYDYSISVIISSSEVNDNLKKEGLLNNAGAVMYSRHKEEWNALILVINDDFSVFDAFEKKITPDSFTPSNWKICRVVGEQLIERGK